VSAQPVPPQAEQYRRDLVRAAQASFGLDAPVSALAAQVMQESLFRADAVSWAGARGLAQMMPATAQGLARQYPSLNPVNEFDPRWSLRAQSVLMRDLVRQFDGAGANECEVWCYAATAYNGGPKWTLRRIAASPKPRRCFGVTSAINPGIRPSAQAENQHYPIAVYLRHEPKFVSAMWGRGVCPNYYLGG
jgi:soluble lytic murein transglycosylase-like protein